MVTANIFLDLIPVSLGLQILVLKTEYQNLSIFLELNPVLCSPTEIHLRHPLKAGNPFKCKCFGKSGI